ncbi:endonuclease/exonuclease/phosphatase family protein [Pontibacter saemangeumensis]
MQIIKRLFFYILVLAGVLLILLTMASLLYDVPLWYIKVLDFPRMQALVALVLCLLLLLAIRVHRAVSFWLLVSGLVASAFLQGYIIYPYTSLAEKAVEDAASSPENQQRFSLLLANVWMENDDEAALLAIIRDSGPDLVLAMETNRWWTQKLAALSAAYPHKIVYPLDNTYGMALYSRFPLQDTEIKFLHYEHVPSFHTTVRLPDGTLFDLHALHPVPPVPSKLPGSVNEKEVALLKVGEMVAAGERPVVVAGDLNDVAWSKTSRLFGLKSGLGDVRVGRGLYNSFNAQSPFFRWPLDHVYVSEAFRVVALERLPGFGSDHFPILVSLALQED